MLRFRRTPDIHERCPIALVTLALPPEDPRHWAVLFTRARLRKGWSYVRLALEAGTTERTTITACTTGHCNSTTALKLSTALGLQLTLPPQTPILTAQQAQYGR